MSARKLVSSIPEGNEANLLDGTSLTRAALLRRTKKQIIGDMVKIINNDDLSYGTKYFCLHDAIWKWTEHEGKLEAGPRTERTGCPYWSEGALSLIEKRNKRPGLGALLRHEHVVPRVMVVDKILGFPPASESWTEKKLAALFKKFCVGVVVTTAEDVELSKSFHKVMPTGWTWSKGSPWARYKANKLKVFEASVTWSSGKFIVKKVKKAY